MRKFLFILAILLTYSIVPCFASTNVVSLNKSVASAGTAEPLASTDTMIGGLTICARSTNTGIIAVGGSGVIAAAGTRTGISLAANECYDPSLFFSGPFNLKKVYIDATVSGDKVEFNYLAV